MLTLGRLLEKEDIYLEIKRGVKTPKNCKSVIKNDELAQLILSFAIQRPGTSRSGKKAIFENSDLYAQLFKVNYFDDDGKKQFLLDIIDLYDRYKVVEKKYKENHLLSEIQLEVLKNGKQVIFALMGAIYRLSNKDISEMDLQNSPRDLKSVPFKYAGFISNYKKDDIDGKLDRMIVDIVKILADSYQNAYQNKQTSSVSNFFKTDAKYYDDIVTKFGESMSLLIGDDLKSTIDIFKRN